MLKHLRNEDEPKALTDIATAMAACEADVDPAEVESRERKRAYVSLYQTHIPRMADKGVLTYDPNAGHVSLSPEAERVLSYLDVDDTGTAPETRSSSVRIYPILVGIGLCLYALVVFSGIPISSNGVGVAVLATLFVVSSAHWLYAEGPFSD